MKSSFETAREKALSAVPRTGVIQLPLEDALGCILAEDVVAKGPLPRWDNSAMDGFAVRAEECSPEHALKVAGFIPAGSSAEFRVASGCAMKIMTGAPIPAGADTVVPVEEAEESHAGVCFPEKVRCGMHIRYVGEDVAIGESVLPTGKRLRAAEISLLTSLGITEVAVASPVRVALLSTGDELVAAGVQPGFGQVIDSNSPALAAAIREAGGEPVLLGIAADNRGSLRKMLQFGLECDLLVTSAGISAGDLDLVAEILQELGTEMQFTQVAVKPGKPTSFGLCGKTPIFSLPGNPVSALMMFEVFVRPVLLTMMGSSQPLRPLLQATLAEPLAKKPGRTFFIRVKAFVEEGLLYAISAGDQNTGIQKTLVDANAIAVLPEESTGFAAGDKVPVILLGE